MIRHQSALKTNAFRFLVVCGAITRGVGEFIALQRSRYLAWRTRI